MRKPVIVLGIPIDPLSMSETLNRILEMVQVGRATGKTHQVATVNADFVVQARSDPELRYLLQRADLLTADGMPLVWGIRWLGVPPQGRVAGADMVSALAGCAAQSGASIYFLGGAPGIADRAAGLLKEKYPALRIAGICSPPFSPVLEMDTSFLADICQARPDILLVAFGNPKQEKWIGLYGKRLGVPVMIGVGGSLDFIAGSTRRAPVWMQQNGLEWLFRLLQEPRRLFRRYIIDLGIFGPSFVYQWWLMRRAPGSVDQKPIVEQEIIQGKPVINLCGRCDQDDLDTFDLAGLQALRLTPHILLNLEQATFLDSSAIGLILELGNQACLAGGELSLVAVPDAILSTLSFLKVDKLFPIYPDIKACLADLASPESTEPRATSLPIFSPSNNQTWIVLKGTRILDATSSQDFLETGASLLDRNPFLICDLSDTALLTSAGLAALKQLRQMAQNRNGELKLMNCSPDTLSVLKKARYDRILPIMPAPSQASV